MTTVYLIRHAEAEGNIYRRCHGQYDALLTTRAIDQLPYLADRFDVESITVSHYGVREGYLCQKIQPSIAKI